MGRGRTQRRWVISHVWRSLPQKDDLGEEEEPTDDIADYEEVDEGLSGEVPNYNEKEVEYVDFLGVKRYFKFS
jgi:hypothetical protein